MNRTDRKYCADLATSEQGLASTRYALAMRYREEAIAREPAESDPDQMLSLAASTQQRGARHAEHARLYLFHLIDEARP